MSRTEAESIPVALLIGQGSRTWPLLNRINHGQSTLQITSIVSHKADAFAIDVASHGLTKNIPTSTWDYDLMLKLRESSGFNPQHFRREYSEMLALFISQQRPKGIVMLGWDVYLEENFWSYFPSPERGVYNGISLHPAPLPDNYRDQYYIYPDGERVPVFRGEHDVVIKQVLSSGVGRYGASMHFVASGMVDQGPVIQRIEFPVPANDTFKNYEQRLLKAEESLVVEVVENFGAGRIKLKGGRVVQ